MMFHETFSNHSCIYMSKHLFATTKNKLDDIPVRKVVVASLLFEVLSNFFLVILIAT